MFSRIERAGRTAKTPRRVEKFRKFAQEIEDLRLKQGDVAACVSISQSKLSQILNGHEELTGEISRRLSFLVHYVRTVQMEHGGFTFNQHSIACIKTNIIEMEESIRPSDRILQAAAKKWAEKAAKDAGRKEAPTCTEEN